MTDHPSAERIAAARARLNGLIIETPVHRWRGPEIAAAAGADTEVVLKLELFQYTGSFKPRGALTNMLNLAPDALARGVTAVSAGNHAIAVAYAAKTLGTSAKVVMMKTANPFRVERCRSYGAEVVLAEDVHAAFETVRRIEKEEGRTFVHPYEGELTILGTATLGHEWCRQAPDLDAIIVPIGGGGLAAGIACAVKQLRPTCQVLGVEPVGADSMHRSFAAGEPRPIEKVGTIADSLGAPFALPYSFGLCRRFLDDLVLIDDDAMRRAMGLLFREMKLAVEPAGAAATAALCGPLRDRLAGKRVGVIVCGSNIDGATFGRHLAQA
ncbi:MAG TPA: pyridoxal-phosphate dependent enzyme [Candidatus Acidoferrum sp.]|nr:pyridoxal-phosphate dependent enzyme [Candidatus Acidoferrum sp.]